MAQSQHQAALAMPWAHSGTGISPQARARQAAGMGQAVAFDACARAAGHTLVGEAAGLPQPTVKVI